MLYAIQVHVQRIVYAIDQILSLLRVINQAQQDDKNDKFEQEHFSRVGRHFLKIHQH